MILDPSLTFGWDAPQNIQISCEATVTVDALAPVIYEVGGQTMQVSKPTFTVAPLICAGPNPPTVTLTSQPALPTSMPFDGQKLDVFSQDSAIAGQIYVLTWTADLPMQPAVKTAQQELRVECHVTSINVFPTATFNYYLKSQVTLPMPSYTV